jgi:hypothetical protein
LNTLIDNNSGLFFLVSAGIAVLALLLAGYLALLLKRVRRDQKVVMGEDGVQDVIAHARATQQRVDGLSFEIQRLTDRLAREEKRMDDCLTFRSVVRYDAYRDLSGMQSTSMCLLDTQFSGIIISSIQSRDHARIYVKEVRHGDSKEKLSPEEIQVLKEAMGMKPLDRQYLAGGGGAA